MKMTIEEFELVKQSLEDARGEGYQHGQAELAEKVIEYMAEITLQISRQKGTVIRVSDFQYFTNDIINSLKSYKL